jgi:uncharacterized protein
MSNTKIPVFHNLLEPLSLLRYFRDFPPQDFSVFDLDAGLPAFSTRFDLLTTMETATRRKLEALPLSHLWRRFLYPQTCFIGTTVTEYALLPNEMRPEMLVHGILDNLTHRYPILIIKDIPTEATLVGDAAHAYAQQLMHVCRESGYVLVEGQALAYVPVDFSSIEAYLARLSYTRRKDLRRKLKSAAKLDMEIIHTGDARFQNEMELAKFYELYLNVYRQSDIHFDLLTAPFFRVILQDPSNHGLVFVYRTNGKIVAYNICFVEHDMLVDKYVGFTYPQVRDYNLYTVSWFRNLEYALENGLRFYIAGWTDPEIKRNLGAQFTLTRHAVYVRNPVLRAVLRSFRCLFEADHRWQSRHGAATRS